MPGFDGTGPNGMGPMTGGGRGYCSPWGIGAGTYAYSRRTPYAYPFYGAWGIGAGTYAYPRRAPYSYPFYGAYGVNPFVPRMSREQELDFLKQQAEVLRDELNQIEAEIGKYTAEQK